MSKTNFRDISPILQAVRAFLLGRQNKNPLRFAPLLATRSPPPPEIPDGSAHKHSANYYCDRDARREVIPPIDVTKLLLAKESSKAEPKQARTVRPTPGPIYHWDQHHY